MLSRRSDSARERVEVRESDDYLAFGRIRLDEGREGEGKPYNETATVARTLRDRGLLGSGVSVLR